jgi:nicotinamidase-related amidase
MDTALLVIDVQIGLFERSVYRAGELLERLRELIQRARDSRVPVIYVQHCGSSPRHTLHPNCPGWAIHPELAPEPGDVVIHKRFLDAFKQTTLRRELEARGIRRLVVTGLQTEMGVDATCRRAAQLGYDVTLVMDGHSTFDNRYFTARQLIEQENLLIKSIGDVRRAESISLN